MPTTPVCDTSHLQFKIIVEWNIKVHNAGVLLWKFPVTLLQLFLQCKFSFMQTSPTISTVRELGKGHYLKFSLMLVGQNLHVTFKVINNEEHWYLYPPKNSVIIFHCINFIILLNT